MENLSAQNCFRIGKFQKTHGISGTLQLNFDAEWEWSILNADVLLTETDGLLLPWFISEDGIRIIASGVALVDLDWIEDGNAAKKLCGDPVYLEKSKIQPRLDEDNFSEWMGYNIFDDEGNFIGEITGEKNYSGNFLASVMTGKGEKMIPFHTDLIITIDKKLKKLVMNLPDGLLEI